MNYPPPAAVPVPLVTHAITAPNVEPASLQQFWWRTARVPLAVFAVIAAILATTDLDLDVAHWLFFDVSTRHWLGADNWWVNDFLHSGGRWLPRVAVVLALALWGGSYVGEGRRHWRRPAGYFVVAVVLTVSAVGLLKLITNVDCPWDLTAFNGSSPYVHLFAHRPHGLPRAQCFPAAHASSGYALMALFFMLRERSRRWALAGLACGVVVGLIFGLAQQSRGAHLLSHDVWSAMLAWLIPLSVYTRWFKGRLWPAAAQQRGE